MHLLNILKQQKAKLIVVLLSFSIALLTISPILKGGLDKVFYTVDPDVVYTANALLYIKSGYVSYFDHPGTPAIVLISLFLAPLRIYAKLIQHTPFITWVFNHYASTFFYLRISQSILLFVSLLIISGAIRILTKSILPVILLFLMLLSFGSFYDLGVVISADTFAFFITSVWLLLLSIYITRKDERFLFLFTFIAGIAFADRATNIFLLPASLLIVFINKSGALKKFLATGLAIINMIVGFVIGVSPTRTHILSILKLVFSFANTTGVHLSGEKTLFNYQSFIASADILIHSNMLAVIIVIVSALSAVLYLLSKKKKYREIAFLIPIFGIGAVAFAKFSLPYYQVANYLVITFCGSVLISRISSKITCLSVLVSIFLFIPISNGYLTYTTQSLIQTGYLEQFVKDNPPKHAVVWSWAQSKEFSYLWNRDYADGMFDDELSKLPYGIYELQSNLTEIGVSKYTNVNIFSVCWDELHIQKVYLGQLLELYPTLGKSVQEIGNSGEYFVWSNHCL